MIGQPYKMCPRCGLQVPVQAPQCARCGHAFFAAPNQPYYGAPGPQAPYGYPHPGPGYIQVQPGTHPFALIVILSLLFGGWVGMLLNRQIAKGLIFGLGLSVVIFIVTCGAGLAVWWIIMLVDAILVANKLNEGRPVREWEFF